MASTHLTLSGYASASGAPERRRSASASARQKAVRQLPFWVPNTTRTLESRRPRVVRLRHARHRDYPRRGLAAASQFGAVGERLTRPLPRCRVPASRLSAHDPTVGMQEHSRILQASYYPMSRNRGSGASAGRPRIVRSDARSSSESGTKKTGSWQSVGSTSR